MRATAAMNLRKINCVEGRPLGEVVTAECHQRAAVVKPVGSATGNGEGSRRRIRTRIALQNPVAQVIVAILRGCGTFATPRQGSDDAHWVCTGLHPRPDAATPARRAHRRWLREALFREKLSGTSTRVRNAPLSVQSYTNLPDTLWTVRIKLEIERKMPSSRKP